METPSSVPDYEKIVAGSRNKMAERMAARKRAAEAEPILAAQAEPVVEIAPPRLLLAEEDLLTPEPDNRPVRPAAAGTPPTRAELENKVSPEFQAELNKIKVVIEEVRQALANKDAANFDQLYEGAYKLFGFIEGKNPDEWAAIDSLREHLVGLKKEQYELAAKNEWPETSKSKSKKAEPERVYVPPADLDEARKRYAEMQRELARASGIKSWIPGLGKGRKKVEEELAKIEADYKKFRAEFVDSSVDNFLAEKTKLTEARLAEFAKRDKNALETVAKWNQKLGEMNFVDKGGYKGPFKRVVKMANARTAISGVLMAVGFVNARSMFGGVTAGLGTYGMVLSGREAYLAKRFKGDESLEETESLMASLESRALLDGKNEQLLNDETYKKVVARWEKLQRAWSAETAEHETKDYLTKKLAATDELLDSKLEHEKKWKKMAVIAGTGTGILVGLGVPGKLIGQAKDMLWGHSVPSGSTGGGHDFELKAPKRLVPERFSPVDQTVPDHGSMLHPATPGAGAAEHVKEAVANKATSAATKAAEHHSVSMRAGASMEVQGDEAIVHAGQRGIEGALIDLQKADPDKYQAMIAHLHETYQDFKGNDSSLIHKFVSDYAHDNGYDIDTGSAKDLSRIFSADIKIGANGNLELGDHLKFMPEHHVDVAHSTPAPVEAPPAPAPNIPEPLEPHGLETDSFSVPDVSAADFHPDGTVIKGFEKVALDQYHEKLASGAKDAAKAVEIILGKDRYDSFLKKTVKLSSRAVNKIQKMNFADFLEKFNSSKDMQETYGNLVNQLDKNQMISSAASGDRPMRQVIIELAKKINKIK